MCKIGGAPVNVFWFAVIPWEADLYFLCYKFWLNVGTTKDLVTLVTSAIHHNSTAKDCKNKLKYILHVHQNVAIVYLRSLVKGPTRNRFSS